ncbi:MAG TPA: hypothetical protein VJ739_06830 [Gemmataceae bacterium]|nr:hypothetical protein [Gemmataceae bacterium]
MLLLIVGLLVVGFAVAVFLWLGSVWLQGYVYSEPAAGLGWRAAATGGAVMLFLAAWCMLDYRAARGGAPEPPLNTLMNFSPTETYPRTRWKHFWAVKKDAAGKEVETEYTWEPTSQFRGGQYISRETRKPWSREANGLTQAILIDEDGQKVRYNLELPPGGKFKADEKARYVEDDGQGRVLTEDDVRTGQVTRFRFGLFVANVLLNLLHLGLWFACFWLLLRFQWPHALGLAVVFWIVMMFAVFPPLLTQTWRAANPSPAPTAAWVAGPGAGR